MLRAPSFAPSSALTCDAPVSRQGSPRLHARKTGEGADECDADPTVCGRSVTAHPALSPVKAAAGPRPDADGLFDPDVSHGQALGAAMFHYRQESVICKSHRTRIMPRARRAGSPAGVRVVTAC